MKKLTAPLFVFSLMFYLLFYFVLFDTPAVISNTSFVVCFILSIINFANSVTLLRINQKQKTPVSLPFIFVFTINLAIFLLFVAYILAAYFLPYHISVG
jgi:hypothetical protein